MCPLSGDGAANGRFPRAERLVEDPRDQVARPSPAAPLDARCRQVNMLTCRIPESISSRRPAKSFSKRAWPAFRCGSWPNGWASRRPRSTATSTTRTPCSPACWARRSPSSAAIVGRALGGRTPLARFRLTGEAYFDFALDHPRDYELMFLTNCDDLGFTRISKEIDERSRPTFEFLVERVEECIEKRVFFRREPREVALYAWSTVHGTASLWLLGQLREMMSLAAFRAHITVTLDLIERALGAPHDAARK